MDRPTTIISRAFWRRSDVGKQLAAGGCSCCVRGLRAKIDPKPKGSFCRAHSLTDRLTDGHPVPNLAYSDALSEDSPFQSKLR